MSFEQHRGKALSPETVATATDSSVSQVHRWIREGKIKAAKLGYRMTRIDGDSLADFLTGRLSTPRPPRGKAMKDRAIATQI
ncbi:MAG: helix-turn-helix domain-containing protein [Dechloromonas sp.]|nr:helix-turn-helix domain-containing protein [Dechloromonas sp.]